MGDIGEYEDEDGRPRQIRMRLSSLNRGTAQAEPGADALPAEPETAEAERSPA
jgi:hypothetical protein